MIIAVNVTFLRVKRGVSKIAARFTRHQAPPPLFPRYAPVTRTQFMTEVRRALSEAGLPAQNYAGHSFRIGAATTAATLGVEDSTIQTLERWKSNAFLTYIKLGTGQLATLSVTLATANV